MLLDFPTHVQKESWKYVKNNQQKVYSSIIGIAFFSKNLPLRHLQNH